MKNTQYLQQARRDFIEAGTEGHYQCPASETDGESSDGRLCVAYRAADTATKHDADFIWLEDQWYTLIGEQMTETNERGYAACVAAYDLLVGVHAPTGGKPWRRLIGGLA
jgi:hypothetical protein